MRSQPRSLVTYLALLVVSGSLAARPNRALDPSPQADVYAALADMIWRPLPDTLLLKDSTVQFQVPQGSSATWQRQFDDVPFDLVPELARVSQVRQLAAALPLPRPMHGLTQGELHEMFASGAPRWTEFHRRYPHQFGYVALSPVVFSSDSLDALVYYDEYCGDFCGVGEAVWLSRRATPGAWKVQKVIRFWVS